MYLDNVKEDSKQFDFVNAKGCSIVEINNLERLLKRPLPGAYREFLEWMGVGCGEFLRGSKCFYRHLGGLHETANALIRDDDEISPLSEQSFVFWTHQGYQFLFFDLEQRHDPPIHFYLSSNKGGKVYWNHYSSLSAFLSQEINGHANILAKINGNLSPTMSARADIHPREYDAEIKGFEELAMKLKGNVGNVYPEKTGTIRMTVEQPICISCKYVIHQFKLMFPNLNVEVTELED